MQDLVAKAGWDVYVYIYLSQEGGGEEEEGGGGGEWMLKKDRYLM